MNESSSAGATRARVPEPETTAVRVRDVTMDFGSGVPAVDRASFDLEAGKFLTILGPSGSGKTTLLRMIAGFQKPTSGDITINGKPVDADPPHRRSIGMVFQKLALFPHMTAAENVAFPLKMRRFDPRTIPDRVKGFLDLVKLVGYGDRRMHELSGGQQQRVAIARALVFEPELLLLDEPLAALDRKLREEMQLEFRRIQHELGVTTINVTHDQREALVVSDRIIVMDGGRIQQHARPIDLYRQPHNSFVAGFLGVSTFIPGEAAEGGLTVGALQLSGTHSSRIAAGEPARGAIRAEQIRIGPTPDSLARCDTKLAGTILDVIFEGERLLYVVEADALPGIAFHIYHHDPESFDLYQIGAPAAIGWNAQDMKIFNAAV
ncbi:ABC transporter ATP-binding protein [Nitratireductor sp. ZSWI3]|uniref:ABC transporter ATP-binding protein n=1 Tax=Nitratireductor sp. ZSWI3 TaxID=2966359 RepID=UPI00214FE844|nr:ABC transporter ATP-binding protein [Nitratireductor sp. ZSWI3]MCR4266535.1 ABC transporter ATP-binding protein [Nitratireductor sp. ZSWI3]